MSLARATASRATSLPRTHRGPDPQDSTDNFPLVPHRRGALRQGQGLSEAALGANLAQLPDLDSDWPIALAGPWPPASIPFHTRAWMTRTPRFSSP